MRLNQAVGNCVDTSWLARYNAEPIEETKLEEAIVALGYRIYEVAEVMWGDTRIVGFTNVDAYVTHSLEQQTWPF